MYDLLKKLNTLVSAQVHDAVSRLPNFERRPDLARQAGELRERVAAALDHEDGLRARVSALQTEIAGLDGRIDGAIAAGQEAVARTLLEEVQRLQKRLSMAESDLREHQRAAGDLILRVNELEAMVGDLRAEAPPPTAAPRVDLGAPAAGKSRPSITDFMPPRADETPAETQTAPAPAKKSPAKPAPAPADAEADAPTPERKPWDKPKTAREAAEWALEDAGRDREQAETGVEQVGGLLRDIQSHVAQRMSDLDRMLQEGGLMDENGDPRPLPTKPPAAPDRANSGPDDDLADRLSRLSKPE